MEQEQQVSQYLPKFASLKKSAEYYLENLNNSSSFLRNSKGQNLNSRIISKIQTLLDVFSSKESLLHVPRRFYPEQFESVLEIIDKSGVVDAIHNGNTKYNDAPHFINFGIQFSNAAGSTDGALMRNMEALGTSRDLEISLSKAVGEFLERYVLTIYKKKNLERGSYHELIKSHYKTLHPLSVADLFSDRDVDSNIKDLNNSPFYWEKGFRVRDNKSCLIPAQLIYWNYQINGEVLLRESNTNGAGGFFTKEGALLSGLYELIQRDAFLAFWLNTLSPPKIDPKTVPHAGFQELVEEASRYGFAIHCLNTTLDTAIPSFIVAIEDLKKTWPAVVIGGGGGANPSQALYHALFEAWSVYYWIRGQEPFELPKNYKPFADSAVGQAERVRLWGSSEYLDKFAFFLKGEEKKFGDYNFNYPSDFNSERDELKEAVYRVESLGEGYEVLGFLADHPLLDQLNYFVAQVVVPSFIPLYLRESNAPLGSKRLKEIPKKLGFSSSELNPWPHPFP